VINEGLRAGEAEARLREYGPNAVAEASVRPWAGLASKFWAPIPWMLEATATLELALGKWPEAAIVALILVMNAMLGFMQESRARATLDLLRQRLAVHARVLRDGAWSTIPAANLVPGDVVHVRMGDLVPADLRLSEGQVLIDQSVLTGESVAVELEAEATAYSGATVVRGEATGEVIATGSRTYFGRTAELVSTAQPQAHLEAVVFRVVRAFIALDLALAVLGTVYLAVGTGARQDVLSFAVVLLLASVPVALPAAFTLAGALGSRHLAELGVLTARLPAVQEAAAMDVLCVDKTGTITQNRLELAALEPDAPFDEVALLRLAAEASDAATQDPIDLAILHAMAERPDALPQRARQQFTPFDPATKRSEATVNDGGSTVRVTKGAPQAIAELVHGPQSPGAERAADDVERLARGGMRVLGVAVHEADGAWRRAGLLGLADPARPDAGELVRAVGGLGVRVVMVTGDTLATARAIAGQVGIGGSAMTPAVLRDASDSALAACGVVAEVLPEDKLDLVRRLQASGHVVGMTGDGVNDAPALREAEVGIAVASATDVAKSAAGVVLTRDGLAGIVSLIEESRRIHQRSLTYALNVSVKKIEVPILLSIGVLAWRQFLFTPLLMALLLLANDVVSMSITLDRVSFSHEPDRWDVGALLSAALAIALPLLAVSTGCVWIAKEVWPMLSLPDLRILVFVTLVLTSQATVYLVRERGHAWQSMPGRWLLVATVGDVAVTAALAWTGVLNGRLSPGLTGTLFAVVLAAALLIDVAKVGVFRRLRVRDI